MVLSMNKELLIYLAFSVDAINTLFSFPLFVTKGPKWYLEAMKAQEEGEQDDKKRDDGKDKIVIDDADSKAFQLMWDLFLVAYEGYFGFTMSTLVCIYRFPETIPTFGYSLFALYIYKVMFLRKNSKVDNAKLYSVLFFFLPCYGGYCALHAWDMLMK